MFVSSVGSGYIFAKIVTICCSAEIQFDECDKMFVWN